VRVDNVYVSELETREGCVGAFDEVFAAEAQVVDFVAGRGEGRVVGAPVDLFISVRMGRGGLVALPSSKRQCRSGSSQSA
jgi:hypothetical protein